MSLLTFESPGPAPKGGKKSLKLVLGIGALAGVIALGSTFAANINLNGGGNVEFGQGVAQTTACDDSVILTPQSTFANSEESPEFLFTSFSVTDISNNCNGKTFTIKAYKNGQDSPLDLYRAGGESGTTYNEVKVIDENGNFSFVGGELLPDDIQDLSSTGFNVDLVTNEVPTVALASAQDVDRITIESSSAQAIPAVYEVGDIGPGGGTIFYYSEEGFNCGENFSSNGSPTGEKCNYLEAAPNTWSGGNKDPEAIYCDVNDPNSLIFDLGAGFKNSRAMEGICSVGAANMVAAYNAINGGGKSDWFLGSINEMAELHAAKNAVGGWRSGVALYWSSSTDRGDIAKIFYMNDTTFYPHIQGKQYSHYVRPIRAF